MTILLIEPNRALAKTYCQALEQAGHSVIWEQKAQAAVHRADKQSPDAVVLELQLARHNGVAFLYEFRSHPDWQNTPVIVHTMVPPENVRIAAGSLLTLGISHYLYKPRTSLKQLLSVLEQVAILAA